MAGTTKQGYLNNRLDYLDGLRASAALFVLVHHAWAMIFPPQLGVHPSGILTMTSWAKLGPYGVAVFIVLAGYSLTLAVARREGQLIGGWWSFICRRGWRILPPYYAALAFTIFLSAFWINKESGTHWDLSAPLDTRAIVVNFLLLQDLGLFEVTDVAYTFWSIAVEWHIYFMFPILLILWRRFGYIKASIAGTAAGVLGGFAGHFVEQIAGMKPEYYSLFAVGMAACAIAYNRPVWASHINWWIASLVCSIGWLLTGVYKLPWFLVPLVGPDILLGLGIASMLIALNEQDSGKVRRIMSWRPLSRLGTFSYSLYLVHAPMLQVFWLLLVDPFELSPGPALLVMWVVAVPLIVAFSFVFHIVAERPFMNRRGIAGNLPYWNSSAFHLKARSRH